MSTKAILIAAGFAATLGLYATVVVISKKVSQLDSATRLAQTHQAKAVQTNDELSDLLSEMNSPGYRFLLLRNAVTEKHIPGWSLPPSAISFSTLTVELGGNEWLGGLTEKSAVAVWEKWQEPRTKLTIQLQEEILIETGNAVLNAIKDREGEAAFESEGFFVHILAANYDYEGGQFVRIAFIESRFADLLSKSK